ncbi:HPr kinase/phosphorylase [Sphingopyxis sp. MWB1]|uniref:HPr kinase/phosphorylase n=1 Tax=Sphingopyxis sp. MWB1 TaxID=1537715 RepID=UPI00051A009B|nr:HPr kinase/phosphatase C-terminal domain-containing protein [Sphingopyxis sp. MWB1]
MTASPAPSSVVNIHASCVALDGRAVLILGASGQGKSDLALRLIDRGAELVADDRCDIWAEGGELWCRPPENLAGKMEVRGIGIIERPWTAPAPLALAVRLADSYERMPEAECVETVAGHSLPALRLSAFEASAPIKVLIALEQGMMAA